MIEQRMNNIPNRRIRADRSLSALALLVCVIPLHADEGSIPGFVVVGDHDLQEVLDRSIPHSVVMCNRNAQVTLSTPVRIRKPLTLCRLNARLPDGLGESPLVIVESEGVTVKEFMLRGNADTVEQANRAPLLIVSAGSFRILNGVFRDGSKDGVMIDCVGADGQERDVIRGVVRDITAYNIIRDVVSISGVQDGSRIRNVFVENVRCYGSKLRGPVEASDGTDNITVHAFWRRCCQGAHDPSRNRRLPRRSEPG